MNTPFAATGEPTVGNLGEVAVLAQIREWLGSSAPAAPAGMGDDTALLPVPAGNLLTTDSLVYGRHFDDSVAPELAGAKLLKRNLSDIASMGGEPGVAVLAGFLPPSLSLQWLERFVRGLAACAETWNVLIVGGDLTQTDGFVGFNLTLTGQSRRALLRTGAQIGDELWVTGALGGSLRCHHVTFTPRVFEGQWLARQPAVHAAIDITDGLAKDLPALLPAGAAAKIEMERLPLRPAASGPESAFIDGEDYELLIAIARSWDAGGGQEQWSKTFPTPLSCIGTIVEQEIPGARLIDALTGKALSFTGGYEHFRGT